MEKMIKLIFLQFLIPVIMDSTKIELINPDGQVITFYKVSFDERQRLISQEVDSLYETWDFIFIPLNIHRLKNGDLLLEITRADFAFVFKDEYNLQLYKITKSYYITSVQFEGNSMYYTFRLTHPKLVQFMEGEKTLISGYESRDWDMFENKLCDYKTYLLSDNSIFRAFKRAENNYYGAWFPNMESFRYYYDNRMTP
jgi:hypothetical protein